MGIIERLNPEMITGAEEAPLSSVPNGESVIAKQIIDALFLPSVISMKN